MKHLSIVIPYYINPGMLAHQYAVWATYPDAVKALIDVVVVDDGSPESPAVNVPRPEGLPPVSIYRVLKDIAWNQHGARNLGAHVAQGPWLLLTDIDHVIRGGDLERLLAKDVMKRDVFMFDRLDAPHLTPTVRPDGSRKPHPNSFALTKDLYWKTGGYDEDYCGMYGTDGLFRQRLFRNHPPQVLNDVVLVRYSRDIIADASTTTLDRRKDGVATKITTKERTEWKIQQGRKDKIATLQFPWEKVL